MDWLKHQLFGEEKLKSRTVTAIRSCRRSGRDARINFGAMIRRLWTMARDQRHRLRAPSDGNSEKGT